MNVTCTAGCSGASSTGTGTTPPVYSCIGPSIPQTFAPVTVVASSDGIVYGKGPFTTDSSLPKIAKFLGATGNATLQVSDAGCLTTFAGGSANGVNTSPWQSVYTYKAMNVSCTTGCK